MSLSHRLIIAVWLSSLSLTAVASVIDTVGFPNSYGSLHARDILTRQTDTCPDDGDCDCTAWGADCDVTDWSWISCDSFPDACAKPTLPPPTAGPIQCAPGNQALYSKCWNDVHKSSVEYTANIMYVQLPNGNMTSSNANITQVYREGANGVGGGHGVTYMMNIGWIPGCTTYESLPADNPMGHSGDDTKNYVALLIDTYNSCTGNSGLGGYVDVGCLRYGFYPTDISAVYGAPPRPNLFWNVYPNICG